MNCTTHRHPERKVEAEARQKAWSSLSPSEQLQALDGRLGKGMGAKKQRARLLAPKASKAPEPAKVAPEAEAVAPDSAPKKLKAKERRAKSEA